MSVKIRLARHGTTKKPFYRIVVAEIGSRRDGKFLEIVGTYNPLQKDAEKGVLIKEDRIRHWMNEGAIPTDTVRSILKKEGVFKSTVQTAAE